jgi:hypothetical protein
MDRSSASEVARCLGANAEAVCRHYLSNGRRERRYWLVGDIGNSPGRSLYVRLADADGGRAAGKWTDAATGDHGDLLDIIAARCGHHAMRETLAEARRFLGLPPPPPGTENRRVPKAPAGTAEAARRLWAASKPLAGSVAEIYLRKRLVGGFRELAALGPLRAHPHCFYRRSGEDSADVRPAWPALIAAVTDEDGMVTGVHRTWLDPETRWKARIACPRRAMGHLLGHGVRFGRAGPVMAAGEGIESTLSLLQAAPAMPMIAGLSAAHLAAVGFPACLVRLYVARDDDAAGAGALETLIARAVERGIRVVPLEPERGDFNDDLRLLGQERFAAALAKKLLAEDALRFLRR